MDVPFLSSGAMSRAHYALVRKIELANSPSQVDQIVLGEIDLIRSRFARSVSNMRQTKEYLVTLLYCFNTLHNTEEVDLDFALSHAVNLAEAGQTVQNKRIGYLYCAEMMPQEHELQLMLVNTLRKDLESLDVPRICLGLEALIRSPSEDVIPAVQDRVHDLLAHNSAHVRRRALLAFRTLYVSSPDILRYVIDRMSVRLRDADTAVAGAALSTCIPLLETGLVAKEKLRPMLVKLLRMQWRNVRDISSRWLVLKYIGVLRVTGTCRESLELLLDIVHTCSRHKPFPAAIVHECFQALSATNINIIVDVQSAAKTTFIASIRHLLLSQVPNDTYLFVTCLECLDTALWAGSKAEIPAVLEGWEVERVIALLDYSDVSVRKKVLLKVDRSLVEAHHTRLLQIDRSLYTPLEKVDASKRILEVIDVLTLSDGEGYAQDAKALIDVLQGDSPRDQLPLFECIVEDVLTHVRNGDANFRSNCLGALFVLFDDDATKTSPTVTVILAALACEHLECSLLPPSHLLQGLSARLSSNGAAIQDALLLSMLRVAADCDEVSDSILASVRKVQEHAGRHIRRRCEQFITLSQSKSTLRTILSSSKSSSLPDFMFALESHNRDGGTQGRAPSSPQVAVTADRPSSRTSSRASHSLGKLRYAAYDAPKPTARLRRVPSNSSLAKSDMSRFVGQDKDDPLSRTITAGDLALATEQIELQALTKSPVQAAAPSRSRSANIARDDSLTKPDLIALDSPFLVEPPMTVSGTSSVVELDFEAAWNKLQNANLRGWCDSPIDVVVRRLQSIQRQMRVTPADQLPFQGDLKILMCPELAEGIDQDGFAALRLREGEEDSCLWHLRCDEGGLRSTIRTLLTDA
ncbi:ARM repeat-containing protein [Cytidiella melzeri]|nr:ARM repeat-containing protein [Cytidiella melzeri]